MGTEENRINYASTRKRLAVWRYHSYNAECCSSEATSPGEAGIKIGAPKSEPPSREGEAVRTRLQDLHMCRVRRGPAVAASLAVCEATLRSRTSGARGARQQSAHRQMHRLPAADQPLGKDECNPIGVAPQ